MHIHNFIPLSGGLRVLFVMFLGVVFLVTDDLNGRALPRSGNVLAPEFEVYSINGRYFSTESLEGEKAVLMFWAPWCGVCRRELPKLSQYYRGNGSMEVQILTIGTAASSEHVKAYVEEHAGTFIFPTVYDDGQLLQESFAIKAYPTYVLLDVDGTIQMVHRGGGILKSRQYQSLVQ